MFKAFKIACLFIIKSCGGFWLTRQFNKGNTCVLCYHGFAYDDEYLFRPKLFMRPQTFARRMEWLKNNNYEVVSLQDAVAHDGEGKNRIALTMDDGWAGTYELVDDVLSKYQFPLMLYVTSYYVEKQGAVINVALAYILWRSLGKTLIVNNADIGLNKSYVISNDNRNNIVNELCEAIDTLENTSDRQQILMDISRDLNVTLMVNAQLLFRLLSKEELTKLLASNVDLQLHSHRHCSPQNEDSFQQEITQNRDYLQQIVPNTLLEHFCYPSGEYYTKQLAWLEKNAIKTSTTISSGMFNKDTDLLQIPRFLDGEDVHQLEFEAELCGLTTFIRKLF